MNDERIAKLVCFGRGGDTVEFSGSCHCSGYGTPERPHAAEPGPSCIIPDGTPVIDKRGVIETEEGFRWVFDGPMVNVDLADDDCDYCPDPSPLMAEAMMHPGNGFGPLLAQHIVARGQRRKRSGLDMVGIREYVEGWREHGARIGHYEANVIIWDD